MWFILFEFISNLFRDFFVFRAIVAEPKTLRPGDTFQMFVRGNPVEFTVPEGAGGGATIRVHLPPDASAESTVFGGEDGDD